MSRYTFGSTGAAAGNALEQFLMQRMAEERQRLLDEEAVLTERQNRSLAGEREGRLREADAQRAKIGEETLASMQDERTSRQREREAKVAQTQAETAGLLYRPGDVVDPTDTQTPAPLRVAQQTVPGRAIPMPGAAAGGVPGVIQAAMAPPGPTGQETFLGTTAQREQEALLADPSLPASVKAMLRAGVKPTAADFQGGTVPFYRIDRQTGVPIKTADIPKDAKLQAEPAPPAAPFPVVIQTVRGPELLDRRTSRTNPIIGQDGNPVGMPPTAEQRNYSASLGRVGVILDSVQELSDKININEGLIATAAGEVERALAKVNLDNDVAEYEAMVYAFTPIWARALGHTGVLTQVDVDSAREALPKPRDGKSLKDRKLARIEQVLKGMKGTIPPALSGSATPTTPQATPTGRPEPDYDAIIRKALER